MNAIVTPQNDTDALRRRALGWSMRLVPVEPTLGAAGGLDITLTEPAVVAGADALGQALTLAFVTLRGIDLFNVQFGFRGLSAIAEETDPTLRRERLRLAVIEVLQQDPRVRRVIGVRYPDELPDAGAGAPTPTTPPRVVALEAEFETIAGERQVIALGGQVLDVR
jgi:hypothetical protein